MRSRFTAAAFPGAGPGGRISQQYAVYGTSERLCAFLCAQAAYRIDPAARKAGAVPETEEGEQLGVFSGDCGGVWFSGSFFLSSLTHCFFPSHISVLSLPPFPPLFLFGRLGGGLVSSGYFFGFFGFFFSYEGGFL